MNRIKALIVGKAPLTNLQHAMLQKLLGSAEVVMEYQHVPITDSDVEFWIAKRPNIVIFEYPIAKPMLKFLKASIPVFAFITTSVPDGTGDLFDGKVKTVGIAEYRLCVKKSRRVV